MISKLCEESHNMIDKKILSNIHAKFRSLRNGEVADLLCQHGVKYHLAWGVQSYQLKQVAESFLVDFPELAENEEARAELAETLWQEDTRESKMLATRLFPLSLMDKEKAITWAIQAPYNEITDQLVMNLLSRLPFAQELIAELPAYTATMLQKRLTP